MRTLVTTFTIIGGDHQNRWPLVIKPPDEWMAFQFSQSNWGMTYYMQAFGWTAMLKDMIESEGPAPSEWLCPTLVRRAGYAAPPENVVTADQQRVFDQNPLGGAGASYIYSVALMSDPRAWDVTPGQMVDMGPARAWVRFDQVQFADRKAAFVEVAARHGNGLPLGDAAANPINVGMCDGHVRAVRAAEFVPPAQTKRWPFREFPDGTAIPGVTTALGARGKDID